MSIGRAYIDNNQYFYKDPFTGLRATIDNRTASYPTLKELNAAAKGILFLHETYKLDWNEAIEGNIIGTRLPSGPINFTSTEKIPLIDLPILADMAFQLNSFDTCIQILRIAFENEKVYPDPMKKLMLKLKKDVIQMNNQNLMKRTTFVGKNFRTLPYLVGENLKKKKKQGKVNAKYYLSDTESPEASNFYLQKVCRGEGAMLKDMNNRPNLPKCKFLHHHNPYLKLGPIKTEIAKRQPWTVVFHDLLDEAEMDFLVEYSKPRLSRKRTVDSSVSAGDRNDIKAGNKRRIVAKTVQCWLNDIRYDYGTHEVQTEDEVHNYIHDHVDNNNNYTVLHPIMRKLSRKIELATQMNATSKWSSTLYQTTNYGLGGLCESHIDPHGHLEGAELPESRKVRNSR